MKPETFKVARLHPAARRRWAMNLVVRCFSVFVGVILVFGIDASKTDRVPRSAKALEPFARGIGSQPKDQPNILVLLIDDADVELLSESLVSYFPTLKDLYSNSVRFRNAFVTTPLCGPSRAAIQRGQYAHRTNILTNAPGETGLVTEPSGGFDLFFEQFLPLDTLATRLDDAGYHTMMVGKYLHANFPGDAGPGSVPPGWDEYSASRGGIYHQTNP